MLKIYGHPMSTCTRKVLATLAEKGQKADFVLVDFAKGEHKAPEHLARQPFGRIPAIDDDGFQMFESRAICRYLDDKLGGKLTPKDAKARAKMEQWISVEASEFAPHAMKFVYQYTFQRQQEPGVLEAAGKALETACAALDKQLAQTPFLAGSELSLADVCYMPYVEYAMGSPAKEIFSKFPHLMTWWNRVSERPAWRKATGKG